MTRIAHVLCRVEKVYTLRVVVDWLDDDEPAEQWHATDFAANMEAAEIEEHGELVSSDIKNPYFIRWEEGSTLAAAETE